MGEEVADKAIGVALVHGEGRVCTGAKDTKGEGLGKGGNELFCCGGEFDEAGEVGGYCIEGGNIGETELAESILEDGNASFGGGRRVGG